MKKHTLKVLFRLLLCIFGSFAMIYAFVFVGGWRLLESGDIILYEVAAAIVVGIFVFMILEISMATEKRIKELEKRIEKLEKTK